MSNRHLYRRPVEVLDAVIGICQGCGVTPQKPLATATRPRANVVRDHNALGCMPGVGRARHATAADADRHTLPSAMPDTSVWCTPSSAAMASWLQPSASAVWTQTTLAGVSFDLPWRTRS